MIQLRGHHLICLHFFRGKGYDAAFLEKLQDVLHRAAIERIEVIEGPDEVCRACPYLKEEQCTHPETSDAEIREMDREALEILDLAPGSTLNWPEAVLAHIQAGFGRWAQNFCDECSWRATCERDPDFLALIQKLSEGEKAQES